MTEFKQTGQQAALIKQAREEAIKGKTEVRPLSNVPRFEDGDEWRCSFCKQDKFGVVKDGTLEVKYQRREFTVIASEARIQVRCRKCGQLNALNMQYAGITLGNQRDVVASEAAQKLADEHGIDLREVEGTGKDGGIIKSDVEAVIEERERRKQEEEARVVSQRTEKVSHCP